MATQPGETDGFNCGDHVRTVEKVIGKGQFDLIICNENCNGPLPEGIEYVCIDKELEENYFVYSGNLVDDNSPWRHDSYKLANSIIDLYNERTGPILPRENGINL